MDNTSDANFSIEYRNDGTSDGYEIIADYGFLPLAINSVIQRSGCETNSISDKYHTFGEMYEHRIALFIALCQTSVVLDDVYRNHATPKDVKYPVWRSKTMSDGTKWDGWFLLGMGKAKGRQITYHLPMSEWDNTGFAETLDIAPEFDGHTSTDVLERLKQL